MVSGAVAASAAASQRRSQPRQRLTTCIALPGAYHWLARSALCALRPAAFMVLILVTLYTANTAANLTATRIQVGGRGGAGRQPSAQQLLPPTESNARLGAG